MSPDATTGAGEATVERFERFYQSMGRAMEWLALANGAILFVLMWLISFDALSRKIFNAPLQGTVEFTSALMPLIVLLPLAYTQFRRGNIQVDLVVKLFGPRIQRAFAMLGLAIGLAFFVWVALATAADASRSFAMNETAWGVIRFEIWPTKIGIVVGATLLALQFLLDLVRLALGASADAAPQH